MYEDLNKRREQGAEQGLKVIAGFDMMTKNPMGVQTKLLLEILQENKETEYGKKYGFGEIKSIEEYQESVPITEYDNYAEYIERMSNNGERNLICNNGPVWYNKTSGTVFVIMVRYGTTRHPVQWECLREFLIPREHVIGSIDIVWAISRGFC